MTNFPNLKYLDITKCMTKSISNKLFYFNKILEIGFFSGNNLTLFPKFCQFCYSLDCEEISNINLECKLKQLKFDLNNLKKLLYADLSELINLEYLNLEGNSISSIEINSFSNLNKLGCESIQNICPKLSLFQMKIIY